jgi:tRNA-guanine family transglycosylase
VEFRSHLDGSKHFFSPEHSMDVQIALGANIAMVVTNTGIPRLRLRMTSPRLRADCGFSS